VPSTSNVVDPSGWPSASWPPQLAQGGPGLGPLGPLGMAPPQQALPGPGDDGENGDLMGRSWGYNDQLMFGFCILYQDSELLMVDHGWKRYELPLGNRGYAGTV